MGNWKISQKVIAIIAIQIIVLLAMLIAVQWQVILPTFKQIEINQATTGINRIKEKFNTDLNILDRFVYEYSYWQDSYDFIRSGTQNYIDENLYEGIANHLGANIMLFITADLNLVWGVEEVDNEVVSQLSEGDTFFNSIKQQLNPHIQKIDPTQEVDEQFASGFTLLNQVPAMFAVRPTYSDRLNKQNGYIVLLKYIDQQLVSTYRDQLQNEFTVEPFNASNLNSTQENSTQENSAPQLTNISPTTLSMSDNIKTQGIPVFTITAKFSRHVTLNGLNSIYLASIILLIVGLLSILFIWFYTTRYIFNPLENLSKQMQEISLTGDYSKQYKTAREDEIGTLAKTFNSMITNIHSQQLELESTQNSLKDVNTQLFELARLDRLTNVANRLAFEEYLAKNWHSFIRLNLPVTVLMIDIDYFKNYNDFYGHVQGDICLKQVAQILAETLKRSNDFLARYGGEEFIAILAGTPYEEATKIAEILLDQMHVENIPHAQSDVEKHVTISIGAVSVIPEKNMDYYTLISQADLALYQAKESGRNRVNFFETPSLKSHDLTSQNLTSQDLVHQEQVLQEQEKKSSLRN